MDDYAAAQPDPVVARRHRPSARQADHALAEARSQDTADVVEERRHLGDTLTPSPAPLVIPR
jgi:hypothetical protein